jgi:NAD(P)H-dependent flavin oxidoreductase YrpB (nitropropane dioxygenase family)
MVFHRTSFAAQYLTRQMKGTPMSRTIEAIMSHTVPTKRNAMPAHEKPLMAIWQTGLEAGGHMQRKLRVTLTNTVAAQPA